MGMGGYISGRVYKSGGDYKLGGEGYINREGVYKQGWGASL